MTLHFFDHVLIGDYLAEYKCTVVRSITLSNVLGPNIEMALLFYLFLGVLFNSQKRPLTFR